MRRVESIKARCGPVVGSNLSSFAPPWEGRGPVPSKGAGDRRSPSPVPGVPAGG